MKPFALLRSASLRLQDEDFAATLPQAPAKPRKSIEGRLFSWAAHVSTRLPSAFGALEVHAVRDPEGDGSGVVFVRERFERKAMEELADDTRSLRPRMGEAPYLPHLHVAIVVYFEAVELSVEVPSRAWVDLENLRARLANPAALLELTSSLELLPEAFELVCPGGAPVLANRATADELRALCEKARADQTALRILWRIPKATVVAFPEDLGDALEDALHAISTVTKLVAWAQDNDLLGLAMRFEAQQMRKLRDGTEHDTSVPSERPTRRATREHDPWKSLTRDEARDLRAERERDPQSFAGRSADKVAPEPEPARRPLPPRLERKILRRAPRLFDVDPHAAIEKGSRVQVLAGPFSGRVGQVVEMFASGEAKVSMGLLVTRVSRADLVACAPKGARRTALPSSHRKLPR